MPGPRHALPFAFSGGLLAATLLVLAPGPAARAEASQIPNLASAEYGWQTNIADWQDPPAGVGHGPIRPDPDHPYTGNVRAAQTGTQPTLRIGNAKDPVLKPWAAAQMQASNEEALKGVRAVPFTSQGRCYPGSVPGQLLFPFAPLYFIQMPKEVWMIWQRDHQVRRVFLTDQHSEHITPSWFGESIGHYENGDTLVIDTVGLSTENSYIDNFRTPHSDKLHVVERFTIEPGGKFLTAIATVEDPDTFNAPLRMKQRWIKTEGTLQEVACAENNQDYFHQNLFPVPTAEKPDF
jgi:hypothetical protein